jgi:hypothetical protein
MEEEFALREEFAEKISKRLFSILKPSDQQTGAN